jgi:hypothetical protein
MPYKDPAAQREYMRRYQREWYQKRRAEFFGDKICCQCGSAEHLELDHRDPSEKVNSAIWSWSEERRAAEIAKCDIRCSKCHKERHAAKARAHGLSAYQSRACRCDICRAAKSAALKRETRRRKTSDSNASP